MYENEWQIDWAVCYREKSKTRISSVIIVSLFINGVFKKMKVNVLERIHNLVIERVAVNTAVAYIDWWCSFNCRKREHVRYGGECFCEADVDNTSLMWILLKVIIVERESLISMKIGRSTLEVNTEYVYLGMVIDKVDRCKKWWGKLCDAINVWKRRVDAVWRNVSAIHILW